MKIKTILKMAALMTPVLLTFLCILLNPDVVKSKPELSANNNQFAFTMGPVFVSANKVGNPNDNNWFSLNRFGRTMISVELNTNTGLYSIRYDLGNGSGWKTFIQPAMIQNYPIGNT